MLKLSEKDVCSTDSLMEITTLPYLGKKEARRLLFFGGRRAKVSLGLYYTILSTMLWLTPLGAVAVITTVPVRFLIVTLPVSGSTVA